MQINSLHEFSCTQIDMSSIHEEYEETLECQGFVTGYKLKSKHGNCVVEMEIGIVNFLGAADKTFMAILDDNESFSCQGGLGYYIDAGRCACNVIHYCKDECNEFQDMNFSIAAIGKFNCNTKFDPSTAESPDNEDYNNVCNCIEDILHFAVRLNESVIVVADASLETMLSEVLSGTTLCGEAEVVNYKEDDDSMMVSVISLDKYLFPVINGVDLGAPPNVINRTDYDYSFGEPIEDGE